MLNQSFYQLDLTKKAMDGAWLRHEAISNNLANVNTPGYKRQDVDFEKVLKDFLSDSSTKMYKTHENHMPIGGDTVQSLEPTIERNTSISYRKDGNNVNVDVEMAELAKNQLKYEALTTQMNNQLSRIKMAIKDGR